MANNTKQIAVLHKNPNFTAAIQATCGLLFEGYEFVQVTKDNGDPSVSLADVPMDCDTVATLNVYPFPPKRKIHNLAFGLKMVDAKDRPAQWDLLKNPESTAIDIAKQLQTPDEVTLIPESAKNSAMNDYLNHENVFLKAPTDEELLKAKNPEVAIRDAQIEALGNQITALKRISAV
jgi:hypothetical protein